MDRDFEIYLITAPRYWYIGSTTRGASLRFSEHLRGPHSHAPLLQAAIRELGIEAFHQTVVQQRHGNPIEAEQRWYDFYKDHDARQTLNGKRPAGEWTNSSYERTPEVRAKISATLMGHSYNRGIPKSAEHRAKLSAANTGKVQSAEQVAKRVAKNTGQKRTEEFSAHQRAAIERTRTQCGGCDLVTPVGPLTLHQRSTGHQGRISCAV